MVKKKGNKKTNIDILDKTLVKQNQKVRSELKDMFPGRKLLCIVWIPVVALLNYIAVQLAMFLHLPFFFDTWGTTLGVLVAGLPVGLAGGVLYNLIMISEWGSSAWVWAFVNIWVAIAVWYMAKKGMVDIRKPGRVLITGVLVGLTAAFVTVVVLFAAWGGMETYIGVLPTYDALLDITDSHTIAAVFEKFITIPFDQIVSIFFAAIVAVSLPKNLVLNSSKQKN